MNLYSRLLFEHVKEKYVKDYLIPLALSFLLGVTSLEGRSQRSKPEPYPPIRRAELGMLKVLLIPTVRNINGLITVILKTGLNQPCFVETLLKI